MRLRLRAAFIGVAIALLWCALAESSVIVRGPYLQLPTPDAVSVVLLTDDAIPVALEWAERREDGGLADFPARTVSSPGREHVLRAVGLRPRTDYAYRVLDARNGAVLAAGDTYAFTTPPEPGSRLPFRVAAFGDGGNGGGEQYRVAAVLERLDPPADLVLLLGDLVYPAGQRSGFDPYFFRPYRNFLRRGFLWPVLGNHDAVTENGAPYVESFWLPGPPEAGERYYAFQHGNVQFLALDSEPEALEPDSPMLKWLDAELEASNAASTADWQLVFLHKPPYARATHEDEDPVRDVVLPILERHGVDLVVGGHSHAWERSHLVRDGAITADGPHAYEKPDPDSADALYLVSGAGGRAGIARDEHPLMARTIGERNGLLVLDFDGDTVAGAFLDRDGVALDHFALALGDAAPPAVPETWLRAGPPAPRVLERWPAPGSEDVAADAQVGLRLAPGSAAIAEHSLRLRVAGRLLRAHLERGGDGTTVRAELPEGLVPGEIAVASFEAEDRAGAPVAAFWLFRLAR